MCETNVTLHRFWGLCESAVAATGTYSAIKCVVCSCQSWLESAVTFFPLLLSISTSKLPGFNPKKAVMLSCAVQSSKEGCLGTIALCCQHRTEVLSMRFDQRVRRADHIYQLCIRNIAWEPLAHSAFAALQRCPGLIAVVNLPASQSETPRHSRGRRRRLATHICT